MLCLQLHIHQQLLVVAATAAAAAQEELLAPVCTIRSSAADAVGELVRLLLHGRCRRLCCCCLVLRGGQPAAAVVALGWQAASGSECLG